MLVSDANQALLTDLYQLTMVQAYWAEEMHGEAVFTLFCRRLPDSRNFLLASGLADALRYLEQIRFSADAIRHLASLGTFKPTFLEWLQGFRFTGDVFAVPEGTPLFADEPILEIVAPLPEAQFVETFVMNQVHLEMVIASKAARVVAAAGGRRLVDFALRRTHGTDAGLKVARATFLAGFDGTSNVLAGQIYGIPVYGTMAHSYVQAHDGELDAFRAFVRLYPETTLLVDTYDTMAGVGKVVAIARELGPAFRVRAIRLDSGDVHDLATRARRALDEAGLRDVTIFATSGLDEYQIADLVRRGAPIDGFGIGNAVGVSSDEPSLDVVYKLTSYRGVGRVKTSPGKPVLPGRKQVYRIEEGGKAVRDVVGRADEQCGGRPLLAPVRQRGLRLASVEPLEISRARALHELARLPDRVRGLDKSSDGYRVDVSAALQEYQRQTITAALRRP
jgi:nicotinate phosphoribosyltransferase